MTNNTMGWDDFIDKAEPELPLDELRSGAGFIPDEFWAITISPKLRQLPLLACIYIDLIQYRHYINNGQLVVYVEFASNGRMHYHCIFLPIDYKKDFEFWVCKQGMIRAPFKMMSLHPMINSVSKRVSKKPKILAKGIYSCMNCFKYRNIDITQWRKYCEKESEETDKILGFHQITQSIWHNEIIPHFKNTYSLDCIFNETT